MEAPTQDFKDTAEEAEQEIQAALDGALDTLVNDLACDTDSPMYKEIVGEVEACLYKAIELLQNIEAPSEDDDDDDDDS